MAPELYLVGSGILSFFDVTLYTQRILRSCAAVFYVHDIPSLDDYLADLNPNVVNLLPIYYQEGRERSEIYDDICRHVLDAVALAQPVAMLMHGHPLVYSTVTERIVHEARDRGHSVEIVPAISSLDRIFSLLELDIAHDGLQVLSALRVVADRIEINPRIDLVLFQIGAMSSTARRLATTLAKEVAPLRDSLLRHYPSEHRVKIVEAAVELGFESIVTEVALGELADEAAGMMTYTASLYVPALRTPT